MLERVAEALATVSKSVDQMRGPLRVGWSQTIAPRLVPPLAQHFTNRYPQVDLRFTEAAPRQIQDDVRHGRLDVALVYAWQADSDLCQEHIADVHLQVMLAAGHRLADRD